MYLSCLLVDVGDNPDRPRPGRLWLRNLYHVHQRLCMAFPSASRKSDDPEFLKPFKPEDFKCGQVHVTRAEDSGFLFRIDPQSGGRVVILVQSNSSAKPDWEYAFHNAGYLLAAPPQVKAFDPSFKVGQRLRFRLVANPTRRLSKHSLGADGQPIRKWANKDGKGMRVPVPTDQLFDWLDRKSAQSGFSVSKDCTVIQPCYLYFKKPARPMKEQPDAVILSEAKNLGSSESSKHRDPSSPSLPQDDTPRKPDSVGKRLRSARYDGILEVTDAEKLRNTLIRGIGPGKAFGFGLLSVAPVVARPITGGTPVPPAAEAP